MAVDKITLDRATLDKVVEVFTCAGRATDAVGNAAAKIAAALPSDQLEGSSRAQR
jgi:hypothetical protein